MCRMWRYDDNNLYNYNPARSGSKTSRKFPQKHLYTPRFVNIPPPQKKIKYGPGYGHDTTEFILLYYGI